MKSNKDLTDIEFTISLDIKRALNALRNNEIQDAKNHLYSALTNIYS